MARRGGFSGWLSRLEGWKLVTGFLVTAIGAGSLFLGGLTAFERKWGIVAANFGFARHASVVKDLRDLKHEMKVDNAKILAVAERTQLWQLYDQIKRTQRNIDNLKDKKGILTAVEREQLQDFGIQLAEATKDYQTLVEKVKKAQ